MSPDLNPTEHVWNVLEHSIVAQKPGYGRVGVVATGVNKEPGKLYETSIKNTVLEASEIFIIVVISGANVLPSSDKISMYFVAIDSSKVNAQRTLVRSHVRKATPGNNTRVIGNGPRNLEPQLSDEDDTSDGPLLPFRTTAPC
ncbi:hypothetical protein TNCV_3412711 [Trichonephila clavipes]|uniref:Uncharacterized protein n=1 Tax=Trichonephila clavipes TaxID=2585209 RepID=A0A8X6RF84_TRICX|nr:hypothetical protein TNCV_3412711 [Trichonephila clavipes]